MSLPPTPAACVACGTDLSPGALFCPACQALVHAGPLKALNEAAEAAQARGDLVAARDAWREALALVPMGSRQQAALAARVEAMRVQLDAQGGPAPAPRPAASGRAGAIGAALTGGALVLWKVKGVLALLLGKGKLLLLGLTKAKTLFSMLAFLGVYWALFGWAFAAGIVGSLYVHEMGHVAALAGLGIRASAPMFIPGLGAFVRMDQYPASPVEDARVGLAGPLWGLATAVVFLVLHLATGSAVLAAIARVGAWINLFNLVPVWQLDGSRGFAALSRTQRGVATGAAAVLGLALGEAMLLIIAAVGVWRTWRGPWPVSGHNGTLAVYVGLLLALGALLLVEVPGVAL